MRHQLGRLDFLRFCGAWWVAFCDGAEQGKNKTGEKKKTEPAAQRDPHQFNWIQPVARCQSPKAVGNVGNLVAERFGGARKSKSASSAAHSTRKKLRARRRRAPDEVQSETAKRYAISRASKPLILVDVRAHLMPESGSRVSPCSMSRSIKSRWGLTSNST